eukprot:c22473_g1_i1 orf=1-333(-)
MLISIPSQREGKCLDYFCTKCKQLDKYKRCQVRPPSVAKFMNDEYPCIAFNFLTMNICSSLAPSMLSTSTCCPLSSSLSALSFSNITLVALGSKMQVLMRADNRDTRRLQY